MAETIIVAGSLAQRPHHGGHTWVFLQYLLGFRAAGYDVVFADWLDESMCVDEAGRPAPLHASVNLRFLAETMDRWGLAECWSLLAANGEGAGIGREDLIGRARRSILLLNVMGYLNDEEILGAAPLCAFLDIDPGFGQMWADLGLADPFAGHDRYITVGGRIGEPGCDIPTLGLDWTHVLPSVHLSEWPALPGHSDDRFTSVASWRGPFGPIEYGGRTYGLRVHELRRFAALPGRAGATFELALDIDDADARDRDALLREGWVLVEPREAAGDPWRYREYIRGSAAELMVAKSLYVDTRSGWFSDRSACYLASGRPVLAQDTGLEDLLPAGEGLLIFADLEEAAAGAEAILADYDRHSRAARELAEEHLAADRVLPRLLEEIGIA
jgi:hypothetical protein